ncbi:MAG: hypothetical protein NTX66_01430 [Candidatus Falkowbacteria bacterium]|nr:hypothetical protein [Candidatus Falkowbacteria bacterium]
MADKINKTIKNPLWFSVSEAAKIGGVQGKTIRRAIKSGHSLTYKIIKNRYQIEMTSLLIFLNKNTKLQNKLKDFGLGQYIEEWRK